jgi:hypothetical protein
MPPGKSKCEKEEQCSEEELLMAVAEPEKFGMRVRV